MSLESALGAKHAVLTELQKGQENQLQAMPVTPADYVRQCNALWALLKHLGEPNDTTVIPEEPDFGILKSTWKRHPITVGFYAGIGSEELGPIVILLANYVSNSDHWNKLEDKIDSAYLDTARAAMVLSPQGFVHTVYTCGEINDLNHLSLTYSRESFRGTTRGIRRDLTALADDQHLAVKARNTMVYRNLPSLLRVAMNASVEAYPGS